MTTGIDDILEIAENVNPYIFKRVFISGIIFILCFVIINKFIS
tara:strand:+ start:135 stop:263 length:129 start_codon:yes stop_codon:yes gene_type:complete